MQWQQHKDQYMIVLARGERVVDSLKLFCNMRQIMGGTFWGLGAVNEAEIAVYDVEHKQYHQRGVKGVFETTHLSGTIGILEPDNELIIHAHMTLSDAAFKAVGGHLVEGRVSGTMEISLTAWPKLTKRHDLTIGLNVFELPQDKI
jgi:predicted DNA-binding protein with PD1-like motif